MLRSKFAEVPGRYDFFDGLKEWKGGPAVKLTFLGAAHEVTGSGILMEACGRRMLIDCGMEQGPDIYENQPLPMAPGELDAILLTHAHIDHSGRIPLMVKQGFAGPVYATTATAQLCSIMLRDSAHIQEFEAEWRNRKAKRAGSEPYVPLYTVEDAMAAAQQFRSYPYGRIIHLFEGIDIRFNDAGHLLGSANIEVWVTENGKTELIVFSGDIGNKHQKIIRNPQPLHEADYVVMECTYGDRTHQPQEDYIPLLADVLQKTFDRGGNVVIPCFAVGRTQQLLYFLSQVKARGLVKGHDHFPVYVDSPLANEATNIFRKNIWDCCNERALALLQQGENPTTFPDLVTSVTSDDSRAINADHRCKVILSASGMCEAGRIRHHLKHNLWRPECTVLFVGYQSHGTLGRALLEGTPVVQLFGEEITVRAHIQKLEGMSSHADNIGLIEWLGNFERKPKKVFVVHGDDAVCDSFSERLRAEYGYDADAPYPGAEYDFGLGRWVAEGNRQRKQPVQAYGGDERPQSAAYQKLVAVGKRLMLVIAHNRGGTNKDLGRFASQLEELCKKWDR